MSKQAQVNPELIRQGFRVNEITMGDGTTGVKLWECEDIQQLNNSNNNEIQANIPKQILQCKEVSRDMNFSSEYIINNLRLEQTFKLHDQPFEFFEFKFGFVIPGSTNNWQQIILASEVMIQPEILSGNLVASTSFFDGDNLIKTINVRIFYV